jgi:hypothetical protein
MGGKFAVGTYVPRHDDGRDRQRIQALPPPPPPEAMARTRPERPVLHVLAGGLDGQIMVDLFSRRGFLAGSLGSAQDVELLARSGSVPAAFIVDLQRPDAARALDALRPFAGDESGPVLVGIDESGQLGSNAFLLDAAFARPCDPARLFVSIVELLADRKKGKGRGGKRITGVVAMVDGNAAFRAIAKQLHEIMSPVCAGAVLEVALRDVGVSTYEVGVPDIDAILTSGRLASAVKPYASVSAVCSTMGRIRALINDL